LLYIHKHSNCVHFAFHSFQSEIDHAMELFRGLTGILLPMWQLEQVVNIGDNKVLVYKIIH